MDLFSFGRQFIILLFGKEYELAYVVTLLLITPITFALIKGSSLEIYRAKDKQKGRTIIYFIIAVINVIISYFACEKYGIVGSAFGTTISIVIGHIIIFNIYDHKVIKTVSMIRFWKEIAKILPAFIIPVMIGVLIQLTMNLDNIYIFLFSIILFSIVYLINIYFIALNENEKKLIKNLKQKFILKKVNCE